MLTAAMKSSDDGTPKNENATNLKMSAQKRSTLALFSPTSSKGTKSKENLRTNGSDSNEDLHAMPMTRNSRAITMQGSIKNKKSLMNLLVTDYSRESSRERDESSSRNADQMPQIATSPVKKSNSKRPKKPNYFQP